MNTVAQFVPVVFPGFAKFQVGNMTILDRNWCIELCLIYMYSNITDKVFYKITLF